MGLYLQNGYINQKWIEEQADKNNISFIVEIGGRQVGKTYGTLKLMLDENKKFILMRRTSSEMEFICNDINNPFKVFKGYDISVKKEGKYSGSIHKVTEDSDPEFIGSTMALSTIAKIRGFAGFMYSDVVFDEFIPENHVVKIKDEGDAFLNAYTTIAGAREELGEKPLRFWLLANPNNIDNAILRTLQISYKIEDMMLKGQEISILKDRGIMIILPNSDEIMKKRSTNSLFRAIGTDNKFSQMALGNEFSYNDSSDVRSFNLKEFKLLMTISNIAIYKHKAKNLFYASTIIMGQPKRDRVFSDTEKDTLFIKSNYPSLRAYYISGRFAFSDLTTKARILDIIF